MFQTGRMKRGTLQGDNKDILQDSTMKRTSTTAETDGMLRRSARIKQIVNAENTPSNNNGDTQADCSGREELKRGRTRKYVPKEEVVHVSGLQAKRPRSRHMGPDDPQPGTSTGIHLN